MGTREGKKATLEPGSSRQMRAQTPAQLTAFAGKG